MGGFARRSFRRDRVSVWDLSGLKNIFQALDQLSILSRPAEREEAAVTCLKNVRCCGREWSHKQRDWQKFPDNRKDC